MGDQEPLMDVNEAVKYLAGRWGMESYSLEAFNKLRQRRNIEAPLGSKNSTFWTKSVLDTITKPDKGNPRPKRSKKAVASQDAALLNELAGMETLEIEAVADLPQGERGTSPTMLAMTGVGLPEWAKAFNLDPDDDVDEDEKPDIKHHPRSLVLV